MCRSYVRFGICLFILLAILMPTAPDAQSQIGYEILGNIRGLQEGEKVVMNLALDEGFQFEQMDSAYVKGGFFKLTGFVPEGPRFYWMRFEKHPSKVYRLLIGNGEHIRVDCDSDIGMINHSFLDNYISFKGSISNHTWHYYFTGMSMYCQGMGGLNRSLRKIYDSVGFDPQTIGATIMAKMDLNKACYWSLLHNPDPAEVSIPAMVPEIIGDKLYERSGHDQFLMDEYKALDEATRETHYGKLLYRYAKLSVGQMFPDFKLPDLSGGVLDLKDVVAKGKLTIINFWAVNSYMRKEYQHTLNEVYKKYHAKGLNIIGVSSDTTDYEWKGFVKTQNFPWYNVSDLKGGDGVVGKVYFEYGKASEPNTSNVLIDENGKIIAWDPSEPELLWYLWKYLDNGDVVATANNSK
ncbi:redoxin domain-containing protein [Dinghuibacter silviterrae]|uniref:Peroxiredoxin n=1 Tax=Dinghuibacter silviterrae TaxID=1539049 RepID=A0A4R8DV16_9BACT|nr:redoxin domain-containing protein [Dinghuibacter silviterrae]TDX01826.1 peroxiredoxin [Dinghuibacter silviterrae]